MAGKHGYYKQARESFLYGPKRLKNDWAELYRRRQAFYSILNKLKREGLIIKRKRGQTALWQITKNGSRKLSIKRRRFPGGIPMESYDKNRSGGVVIVSYDIPERERKKRHWLRENLLALGFSLLQKSVWVGTTLIPEELIQDLKKMSMLDCVHIFSVDKSGTVEERAK